MDNLIEKMLKIDEGMKDLEKRYVLTGKISKKLFDELSSFDHTPSKKYVSWLIREYLANPEVQNRYHHLKDVIRVFDRLASKNLIDKDIYRFDLENLEKEFQRIEGKKSKREVKKQKKEKGAEVVKETDRVLVLHIKTFDACKLYGMHTKWCITMRQHWEDYEGQLIRFYFVVDKKKKKKYAVAVHPITWEKEVYDEKDEKVPFKAIQKLLEGR